MSGYIITKLLLLQKRFRNNKQLITTKISYYLLLCNWALAHKSNYFRWNWDQSYYYLTRSINAVLHFKVSDAVDFRQLFLLFILLSSCVMFWRIKSTRIPFQCIRFRVSPHAVATCITNFRLTFVNCFFAKKGGASPLLLQEQKAKGVAVTCVAMHFCCFCTPLTSLIN